MIDKTDLSEQFSQAFNLIIEYANETEALIIVDRETIVNICQALLCVRERELDTLAKINRENSAPIIQPGKFSGDK